MFFDEIKGLLDAKGSFLNTSIAAPAIIPLFNDVVLLLLLLLYYHHYYYFYAKHLHIQ